MCIYLVNYVTRNMIADTLVPVVYYLCEIMVPIFGSYSMTLAFL